MFSLDIPFYRTRPVVSTLNAVDGAVTSNMAIRAVGHPKANTSDRKWKNILEHRFEQWVTNMRLSERAIWLQPFSRSRSRFRE